VLEDIIVCGACSLAVPRSSWRSHAIDCHRRAEQLALTDDLHEAVELEELADERARGLAKVVQPPAVGCVVCGSQAGELCVSKKGNAMLTPHSLRRDLARAAADQVTTTVCSRAAESRA
jgi:hypothetical protein